MSIVLLPAPVATLATAIWVAPDGGETVLHDLADVAADGSYKRVVAAGATGLGMLPVSFGTQKSTGVPGARVREVRHESREIDLPMFWQDASPAAITARVAALFRAVDPRRGEGTLRVKTGAGEWRDFPCRYVDGLGGDTSPETKQRAWRRFVLRFRADDDPYCYESAEVVETIARGTPRPFFSVAPLRVNTPALYARIPRTNGGDVDAWPVWTITGPGRDAGLFNATTGSDTIVLASLGAGQTLTIDTRPRQRNRVRLGDGTSLFSALTPGSTLWPLVPGVNEVSVNVNEAGAGTSVALSWRRGYLGID